MQLRQLGGVVVAGAALVGWLAAPQYPRALGVTAAAAAAITVLGVADNRRALAGVVRIGAYVVAAAAAVTPRARGYCGAASQPTRAAPATTTPPS